MLKILLKIGVVLSIILLLSGVVFVSLYEIDEKCCYCGESCGGRPLIQKIFDPGAKCHIDCFWKAHPIRRPERR